MAQDCKTLRYIYYGLFGAFSLLIVLGMVNVFSSTFVADRLSGNTYYHLMRQIVFVVVGLLVSLFIYRIDYHSFRRFLPEICLATVGLLVLVFVIGVTVNGARRWIGAGSVTFQPSELAKLTVILYVSSYLAPRLKRGRIIGFVEPVTRRLHRLLPWWPWKSIPSPALWIPFVLAALVAKQPDMGTAIVIFIIPCAMILVSGAHIKKALLPIFVLVVGATIYASLAEYRMNRLVSWLDPWSYAQTLGYQTVQSLIAIGSGGFAGQGLGTGISKFSYLPEAHTDFAFAIFAQEWGLMGSVLMLGLFSMVVVCGMFCASQTRDPYGRLLVLGMTLYLGGQGFINMAMVSGLLPVVGVPLPFISYGGSSLVVNMAAAAVLLNVAHRNWRGALRRQKLQEEAKRQQPEPIEPEVRSRFSVHDR